MNATCSYQKTNAACERFCKRGASIASGRQQHNLLCLACWVFTQRSTTRWCDTSAQWCSKQKPCLFLSQCRWKNPKDTPKRLNNNTIEACVFCHVSQDHASPPTPTSAGFTFSTWCRKKSPHQGNLILFTKGSKGIKVLETAVGAVFCPDQVLLSKTFFSRAGCRRKILTKEFWGWGWESISDPQFLFQIGKRKLTWERLSKNKRDRCLEAPT